jgi:hypothetical protein
LKHGAKAVPQAVELLCRQREFDLESFCAEPLGCMSDQYHGEMVSPQFDQLNAPITALALVISFNIDFGDPESDILLIELARPLEVERFAGAPAAFFSESYDDAFFI